MDLISEAIRDVEQTMSPLTNFCGLVFHSESWGVVACCHRMNITPSGSCRKIKTKIKSLQYRHQSLFDIYDWTRSQPMKDDITYAKSSPIGSATGRKWAQIYRLNQSNNIWVGSILNARIFRLLNIYIYEQLEEFDIPVANDTNIFPNISYCETSRLSVFKSEVQIL